jgi:uncharacterized protein (DUF362 family)/NAD-dependent dihydropyrimidine dehydrogenase PreA subunit
MGTVAIYRTSYETVAKTVRQAFEDCALDVARKSVLIKPNILGPFEVDRHITTHPSVVAAVLAEVRRRGPRRVFVGDNPGMRGYGANLECARRSGILAVCDGAYVNLSEAGRKVSINSRFIQEVVVSGEVLDADILISVPKMKTHLVTTLTAAIKNSFGHLVGGQKAELHRRALGARNFSEIVVDVYQLRPPDFVVVDGVVAMEGRGPSSDELYQAGVIVAGTNGVEVDAVVATLMGAPPQKVPMLTIARDRGLGEIDPNNMKLKGDLSPLPNYKLPSSLSGGWMETLAARLLTHVMVSQPVPITEKCVRCGMCARHCPVEAITMNPYPTIDKRRCISCFCCHEFCKYTAMDVGKTIKFLRKRFKY